MIKPSRQQHAGMSYSSFAQPAGTQLADRSTLHDLPPRHVLSQRMTNAQDDLDLEEAILEEALLADMLPDEVDSPSDHAPVHSHGAIHLGFAKPIFGPPTTKLAYARFLHDTPDAPSVPQHSAEAPGEPSEGKSSPEARNSNADSTSNEDHEHPQEHPSGSGGDGEPHEKVQDEEQCSSVSWCGSMMNVAEEIQMVEVPTLCSPLVSSRRRAHIILLLRPV